MLGSVLPVGLVVRLVRVNLGLERVNLKLEKRWGLFDLVIVLK